MQVTVEIPDALVARLNRMAEETDVSIGEVLARRIEEDFAVERVPTGPEIRYDGPRGFPRILSKTPGSVELGAEGVNEYLVFP